MHKKHMYMLHMNVLYNVMGLIFKHDVVHIKYCSHDNNVKGLDDSAGGELIQLTRVEVIRDSVQ